MLTHVEIEDQINAAGIKIRWDAWAKLSRVLQMGWVQDYKHLFSKKYRYDIGTPETVKIMLNPELDIYGVLSKSISYALGIKREDISAEVDNYREYFENLIIEGYLLGTDFISPIGMREKIEPFKRTWIITDEDGENGENQLEGELRRYWARKNNRDYPRQIHVTLGIIKDYCETNGLNHLIDKFADRLGLTHS